MLKWTHVNTLNTIDIYKYGTFCLKEGKYAGYQFMATVVCQGYTHYPGGKTYCRIFFHLCCLTTKWEENLLHLLSQLYRCLVHTNTFQGFMVVSERGAGYNGIKS